MFIIKKSIASTFAASITALVLVLSPVNNEVIKAEKIDPNEYFLELNSVQLDGYDNLSQYQNDLKQFVTTKLFVKPYDQFTLQEKQKWEKLFANLSKLTTSLDSAQPQFSIMATFDEVQKGIEATITSALYTPAVTLAVKTEVDRANTEQIAYKNSNGFTSTLENEVDAFRHFAWNYYMVDNVLITRQMAKVIADNHEFSPQGARYAIDNYPNANLATQVAHGVTKTNTLKSNALSGGSNIFKTMFNASNFMDFNNNEAGRGYAGDFSNVLDAFEAAMENGHVTTSPSEWSLTYAQNSAYAIFIGDKTYNP